MKILIYCFGLGGEIAYRTLNTFRYSDLGKKLEAKKIFKPYHLAVGGLQFKRAHSLAELIKKEKPEYVLGLANYRKDGKYIRIEKEFLNTRGKKKIDENGENVYFANWDLKEELNLDENFKNTNFAGNGPCNYSGYLIAKTIKENNLKTKFAFLHIPRKSDNLNIALTLIQQITYNSSLIIDN